MEEGTRTELEAAAVRRLAEHPRERTGGQNIEVMELAGFCRNCLSKWYRAAAEERGVEVSDAHRRGIVYGMGNEGRKARRQTGRAQRSRRWPWPPWSWPGAAPRRRRSRPPQSPSSRRQSRA